MGREAAGGATRCLTGPGRWLVLLRAALVVVGIVAVAHTSFPPWYEAWAWAVVGFFAAETVASGILSVVELDRAARTQARVLLVACDALVGIGFVAVFSYEAGEPYRALYLIPIAEAALRFGLVGGALAGAVMTGATIVIDALGPGVQWRTALVRVLVGMLSGIVIGRLRDTLNAERSRAEPRAAEAERLRDELGHRVDVLETANRCARALGSSLELDEAFGAFIRELRGLVPFERTAIVLVEGQTATTMATAGLRRERGLSARQQRADRGLGARTGARRARSSCAATSRSASTRRTSSSSRSACAASSSRRSCSALGRSGC